MGGHGYISDSTTTYSTQYVDAESTPPTTARFKQECGCYETSHSDESDRVWVTYTHYTRTYYLCVEHMNEYRKRMEVIRATKERERIEAEELEKIWVKRCIRAEPAAKKEQQSLVEIMDNLKLPRLREIKNLESLCNWSCHFHRGYIILRFTAVHSQFCPVKDELFDMRFHKGRKCSCVLNLPVYEFKYMRQKGKYIFKHVQKRKFNVRI